MSLLCENFIKRRGKEKGKSSLRIGSDSTLMADAFRQLSRQEHNETEQLKYFCRRFNFLQLTLFQIFQP